jgi:DNA-binding LytR/AlgR family response regulator
MNIAILEDDDTDAVTLKTILVSYLDKHGIVFNLERFSNPLQFPADSSRYDLIFLDIMMPNCNGMDFAKTIRKSNATVSLVFVTNMLRYAVEGYAVEAADFIVKPINSYRFERTMDRLFASFSQKKDKFITIKNLEGMHRINIEEIAFIEVRSHRLSAHKSNGDILEFWGNMKETEAKLPKEEFVRCNNCYLINLHYVKGTEKDMVDVQGTKLKISRSRKKIFLRAMMDYLG